jgi:ABC-type sugar transport system permease subunit
VTSPAEVGGAAAVRARSSAARLRPRHRSWRSIGVAYLLITPALALSAAFFFLPMALSLLWSFTRYNGLEPFTWVGFDNYRDLLTDPLFRRACQNTVVFAVVTMAVGPALGFFTALMLNRRLVGRTFFRAAFFIPVTTSLVVVSTIWKMLLNDQGLLNRGLALLGVAPHAWLTDPSTALPSVCAASIWQGFGFETVIFLAAMQSLPRDLYDAAKVDGAPPARQVWHITLPGLRPTGVFVYIVGIIGAFQAFDQVFVMTQGGPVGSTVTIVYYLVERFRALDLGGASAAAYLLCFVLAVMSFFQMRLSRRFG